MGLLLLIQSCLQALHEVHKILGQVNILGSPIVLGSNIFEGLSTFFKEPLKAKNPKQFARGIGKGSVALVKFSAFGFLEALGQVRQHVDVSWLYTKNSSQNLQETIQ